MTANAAQTLVNVNNSAFEIGHIRGYAHLARIGTILGCRNCNHRRNDGWACARSRREWNGHATHRHCQTAQFHYEFPFGMV